MAETTDQLRVLLAGGGTGGHLFPALAIQEAIRELRPDTTFAFVGTKHGLESRILPERGEKLFTLNLTGLRRGSLLQNIATAFRLMISLVQSFFILRKFKPQIVIGTGGYVMGPVLLLAQRKGIPTLLQEQNSCPGLTTRKLAPRASAICLAFEDAALKLRSTRIHLTGNPVRKSFQSVDRSSAQHEWRVDTTMKTLLVLGGSQGAKSINNAVARALDSLIHEYNIIWQTGRGGAPEGVIADHHHGPEHAGQLRVRDFIQDMASAYAAADLAVCRAGAMTIAELALSGLPAIFIPFPYATDDHQTANAQSLVQQGAARLIPDGELTEDRLHGEIKSIIDSNETLRTMRTAMSRFARPNAAHDIAERALKLIRQ